MLLTFTNIQVSNALDADVIIRGHGTQNIPIAAGTTVLVDHCQFVALNFKGNEWQWRNDTTDVQGPDTCRFESSTIGKLNDTPVLRVANRNDQFEKHYDFSRD